ncbi:MAG: sulfatase [Sedimentisphaerales bacterium]|nr:sulfatase [Sedimentisphaerales bacterium]
MTMTRRQFLQKTLIGSAAFCRTAFSESKPLRPNIMLIIGDDMTCEDCEPYGSKQVRTPNIARLAREGMCFDRMFTTTAMCAPTRQQLYTGMYPIRNGAYPNHSKVYDGVKSLPHYLKALGYRVGLIGKKHFGPPTSFPFEIIGGKKGASDTQAIAKFVNRDREQPYCLIVCSNEPHGPWNLGDPSIYKAEELTIPPYLVDCPHTRQDLTKYYAEITYLDGQLGDCMKIVDGSGGREDTMVIFTSEQGSSFPFGAKWTCYEMGLKTAFIVRWPATIEAGSRNNALTQYVDVTPTLIEAAGDAPETIQTGRPDAHGETGFDGRSFLNVLFGQTDKHREYLYGAHTTRGIINGSACYPVRSVRDERYKYIWNPNYKTVFYNVVATKPEELLQTWKNIGKTNPTVAARARFYQHRPEVELYDLKKDPYELTNLADDPAYDKIKVRLRKELDRWMTQQGDEGNATEMKAIERQGPNRKWKPYEP